MKEYETDDREVMRSSKIDKEFTDATVQSFEVVSQIDSCGTSPSPASKASVRAYIHS